QQIAILPAPPQIDIPSLPPESVIPQTLQPASKQNFLQSYRWKKLISLLAFFSFCWLSFLSALVIIILLGGDKPNP
ncbi:TPA: hypothetical protein ACGEGE_002841, partial [Yersinia enterocolitica]